MRDRFFVSLLLQGNAAEQLVGCGGVCRIGKRGFGLVARLLQLAILKGLLLSPPSPAEWRTATQAIGKLQ